jgi:hypothetical protein
MTDKEILQAIDRLDAELPFDEICVGGKDNWHDIDVHELLYEVKERIKEWHYPSRGEYPTEKELVLMKIPGCYVLGWYDDGNWFIDDGELTVLKCTVSRWQYIVPPKEEA